MAEEINVAPDEIINVSNKINYDLTKIIAIVVTNIYKVVDISNLLINEIINSDDFLDNIRFIREQTYIELINNIIKPRLVVENEFNSMKCGHIVNKNKNGINDYCNLSKYLHYNDSYDKDNQIYNVCDHPFIQMTEEETIVYNRNNHVINCYQNYLDTLYIMCYNILIYYIYKDTKLSYINIYDIESLNVYFSKTQNNHRIFKNTFKIKLNGNEYIQLYQKIAI